MTVNINGDTGISQVQNNVITADNIATGAITAADIADGAITNAKIASVDATKLSGAIIVDSNGYVTKSNQPVFAAQAVQVDATYGVGYVPYPNIIINNGNHYNTSTSTFTAPINGIYVFTWSTWHNVNTTARTYLHINGSEYKSSSNSNGVHLRLSTNDNAAYGSAQIIAQLNENDAVRIYNGEGDITLFFANIFTGYLIG